jgi:hypothetical protein
MIKMLLPVLLVVCFLLMPSNGFISGTTRQYQPYVFGMSFAATPTPDEPYPLNRNLAKRVSEVLIESPGLNSRRITANTIIDGSIEDVWSILTDYDNLATHIPNLVQSYRVPTEHPSGISLYQEGAQKIVGFDFRASLTMNMDEVIEDGRKAMRERRILFKHVDSLMFNAFDGEWLLKLYSRSKKVDPLTQTITWQYKTQLTYTVFVRPRGVVPVMALEWRIREDIPLNLLAVKIASEKVANRKVNDYSSKQQGRDDWSSDETLGMYINNGIARTNTAITNE